VATYPITIVNPGAESGSTTGWTDVGGTGGFTVDTSSPHSGTYRFRCTGSLNNLSSLWEQVITIDPGDLAAVDAGQYTLHGSGWFKCSGDDGGALYIKTYDASMTLLSSEQSSTSHSTSWTQITLNPDLYPGTRYITIGTTNSNDSGDGIDASSAWDDFELWFDDTIAVSEDVYQLGAYALGQQPAEETSLSQGGIYSMGAAETSSTFHDVISHQLGAYALVMGFPDRRDITAWTFTQDDHDFYVLQIGAVNTLVYDTSTKQWSDWRSPGYTYWRAIDGVAWEGYNVAIDPLSNKIWEIDPLNRLDYGTTPIRSIVTGMFTERYRKYINCFMAELAVSEAEPPTGIDASTVGITLRTYQQSGIGAVNHGEITGENVGDDITVRWYGLGLAKAPGHVFEITDTGYARRIDGFDVDIGDFANGSA
jgi:hypothetical protein